jgi:CheY-like chemotaxis protein
MSATAPAPARATEVLPRPRLRLVSPGAAYEIRVLIVDGQALVRAAFRLLLESEAGISVVAEASTADEAVDTAARIRPDVVLIDAALDGCLEATREIAGLPHPRVPDTAGSSVAAARPAASRMRRGRLCTAYEGCSRPDIP